MKLRKFETASMDVDAQNGFTPLCPNELPVPEGDQIVAELNQQAKYARIRVGSKEVHPPNALWIADEKHPQLTPIEGVNLDFYWNAHCISGTRGAELLEALPKINEYDFFVFKGIEKDLHPYGSCFHDQEEKVSTGLNEFLKTNNIKNVVIGGLATDYCVKATALQLLQYGFNVILNLSSCRGLSEDTISTALNELKNFSPKETSFNKNNKFYIVSSTQELELED